MPPAPMASRPIDTSRNGGEPTNPGDAPGQQKEQGGSQTDKQSAGDRETRR
jgi:hypothetical protein